MGGGRAARVRGLVLRYVIIIMSLSREIWLLHTAVLDITLLKAPRVLAYLKGVLARLEKGTTSVIFECAAKANRLWNHASLVGLALRRLHGVFDCLDIRHL